jgi:3-phenylpropionate/trans-cinnamate dioxygenase ferredoxin reductase subunit
VPWFWSDQYDLKLQMVGLSHGHDRMVMRGSTQERRFALFYFKNNALIAIETVNRAADHMAGRHLLGSDLAVTAEQIADPDFDLAATVKAHQKATR